MDVIIATVVYKDNVGLLPLARFIWMRALGCISFPIFAFLVAQDCVNTKNIKKYLSYMIIFAFISEIPYNLFLNFKYYNFKDNIFIFYGKQNILFTLSLGIFAIIIFRFFKEKESWFIKVLLLISIVIVIILGGLLRTEDGSFGVALVLILYWLGSKKDSELVKKTYVKQAVVLSVLLFARYVLFLPVYGLIVWVFIIFAEISVVLILLYKDRDLKKQNLIWLFFSSILPTCYP